MMTCCTLWLFLLMSQPDGSAAMSGGVLLTWKTVPCKYFVRHCYFGAKSDTRGTYWKSIGDAMNISYKDLSRYGSWKSGLDFFYDVRTWSEEYEKKCMVPDMNNKLTADETTKMLLYDVPPSLQPYGRMVVSALLDDRLRTAMMYEEPPSTLKRIVEWGLNLRKYVLRWAALPRPWILRVSKIPDNPKANGRIHALQYQAEPW
jgi:hypothetical protein